MIFQENEVSDFISVEHLKPGNTDCDRKRYRVFVSTYVKIEGSGRTEQKHDRNKMTILSLFHYGNGIVPGGRARDDDMHVE